MVAENSLLAYKEVKETKQRHYELILNCIEMHPNIDYLNISYLTGICPATVTARLNELRYDLQKITTDGSVKNKSLYRIRLENEPLNERQPKFKAYFMELFDNYGYLIPRNEFDKLLKLR